MCPDTTTRPTDFGARERNDLPRPPRGRLLPLLDAAAYLSTNERWMRRAVIERVIPFTKVGQRIMYYQDDLDAYLAANEVPAR